jgi:hypothetical protein
MKDFNLGFQRVIEAKEQDEVVHKVQRYLLELGYLKAEFTPGLLDEITQGALAAFQRRRGIDVNGVIDLRTAQEIELPRCGVPDFPLGFPESGIEATPLESMCSFRGETELSYAFEEFDVDGLLQTQIEDEIAAAFEEWQRIIGIQFNLVNLETNPNPNFIINWLGGTHMVGDIFCTIRFDGGGRYVGHAFPRESCAETPALAGQCHFDLGEFWSLTASSGLIDLQTAALHEIGHLLGLHHLGNSDAVMHELYPRIERRVLHPDDIEAVQLLYGLLRFDLEILVHFEGIEDRRFRDKEFTEIIDGPGRLKGFQLNFRNPPHGLSMRYMALVDNADSDFVEAGTFIGTRDPEQTGIISGFAIELVGPRADKYNVFYKAKIQDIGVTPVNSNGSFCGYRSQSKAIESFQVWVELRP